ncbi:hypothetical protein [Umezawaea sp. Da 62-37]|uniref:hypothetical protein n=1 Tax=Umezawaea sp. Da 62-37 TaxID=3075927 RepID=UPI0028F73B2F|nr:hypothetical protein [Umezawaea sp. Da 62-37]WNV87498.1 hypothetical protein RM788_04115 [Umezawaea sp. Da 62-37]
MRSTTLLVAAVLAVPLLSAAPAIAITGGTESTRPYSFAGSFQPAYPRPPRADGHGCGVEVLASTRTPRRSDRARAGRRKRP